MIFGDAHLEAVVRKAVAQLLEDPGQRGLSRRGCRGPGHRRRVRLRARRARCDTRSWRYTYVATTQNRLPSGSAITTPRRVALFDVVNDSSPEVPCALDHLLYFRLVRHMKIHVQRVLAVCFGFDTLEGSRRSPCHRVQVDVLLPPPANGCAKHRGPEVGHAIEIEAAVDRH